MSINDLMNDENLLPLMFLLFVVIMIFAIPAGIAINKKSNSAIYGDDECGAVNVEKGVKILARHTSPHPLNQAAMINMVVFELASGERIELAIKDANRYATMVEGDCGILRHQGKRFIDFERRVDHAT